MAAQIELRGRAVSDRFPTLSFTIRSDAPMDAEVTLASDPSLFRPENQARRNASNFYTSGEDGITHVRAGTSTFDVPARVLARLVGTDRLYFALSAGCSSAGGLHRETPTHAVPPFVSLRSITGRTLR
jgi:hypothetical protein